MFLYTSLGDTALYTLSLHDALPIFAVRHGRVRLAGFARAARAPVLRDQQVALGHCLCQFLIAQHRRSRSEEHTSELQSQSNLVCRLLLEKKKKQKKKQIQPRKTLEQ